MILFLKKEVNAKSSVFVPSPKGSEKKCTPYGIQQKQQQR
jgi:hypothetical protein